jgi:hypothetical protein
MMMKLLVAVAVAGGWATGCAQAPPTHTMPEPMLPTLTLETAVQAALADAARRTGLPVESLQVQSAAAVTWGDGALGCPQPGMVYTQALVPGFRVRIQAGGQGLDYHAGRRGAVVLCPRARAVEPLPDDARR